ncbi:MAG: ABC transporter permease [Aggregatilineales bacterium]
MRETALYLKLTTVARQPASARLKLLRHLAPLAAVLIVLGLWQVLFLLRLYPPFIIPSPLSVAERFYEVIVNGRLWTHISATLSAVLVGLAIGVAVGLGLGYAVARSRVLDALLLPLIAAAQSTPVVAYAPLLVIWFGSGLTSKIVTSALIVFFPMLLNTVVGFRGVPRPLHDLMRAQRATRWQMFTKLELPAALPVLLGGLKISATLSVIGAVVGEFVNANAGLGFLINLARSQYDTPLVLVSVITLAMAARLLYGGAALLERYLLRWQQRAGRSR